MRFLSKTILAGAFGLTAVSSAAAQTPPDFSGTWVLVVDKSSFGGMPGPDSRTDVIDHKGSAIIVKRTQTGTPMGKIEATLTYGVDGKPYKNSIGGNDVTSTLKWEGAVLVIESRLTSPNGEALLTDRWSLSSDGKTLTQERNISMQGQEAKQKMVFAKQ